MNYGSGLYLNGYESSATNYGTGAPINALYIEDGTANIGVGTASPAAGLKLDVEGKVGATEYCDENGLNCTAASALGGTSIWSQTGSTAYYNNGNVGIGTDSPGAKIEVSVNGTSNGIPVLRFSDLASPQDHYSEFRLSGSQGQ